MYQLNEVNEELRELGMINLETPLPEYAGGGDVGLLIRIQNVQFDPVLLGMLPSGIGCPFVDKWGSSLAFAGPHPSFTGSGTDLGDFCSSMMMHVMK